jgi:hypothetical protein
MSVVQLTRTGPEFGRGTDPSSRWPSPGTFSSPCRYPHPDADLSHSSGGVQASDQASEQEGNSPESWRRRHAQAADCFGPAIKLRRTGLESLLRSRGITTVIVTGLVTDICVSSTARDAFQLDFHTITLSDCTAAGSQARHDTTLETLARAFGRVCSSEDVAAAWQTQPVPAGG